MREGYVREQVEAFAQVQPLVKVVPTLNLDYAKITALIVAGTPPDVFACGSHQAVDFLLRAAVRDLAPLVKRDKLDTAKLFYPEITRIITVRNAVTGLPQGGFTSRRTCSTRSRRGGAPAWIPSGPPPAGRTWSPSPSA